MDLLCNFANDFPAWVATVLDRDRHKRRNFREETVTDMLMAGLIPFQSLGIHVDFPIDESLTGEDMDWEFVNERAVDGKRFLRLHIQAKRAIVSATKAPYWYYRELDHALPPASSPTIALPLARLPKLFGRQHEILLDEAAKIAGCVPIYMFYHPSGALAAKVAALPAVDGLNWIFADLITKNVSRTRWPVDDRKVERWRPGFRPLSDLLCVRSAFEFRYRDADGMRFVMMSENAAPSPGMMADRLNAIRLSADDAAGFLEPVGAVEDIPQTTLAAISSGFVSGKRSEIPRPRVIFHSR